MVMMERKLNGIITFIFSYREFRVDEDRSRPAHLCFDTVCCVTGSTYNL